jgi:hypothetical protein
VRHYKKSCAARRECCSIAMKRANIALYAALAIALIAATEAYADAGASIESPAAIAVLESTS